MENKHYLMGPSVSFYLPVTPQSYTWERGINLETVNISQVGDVYLPGWNTRYAGKIECLFPARSYSWAVPGALTDPWYYHDTIAQWAETREPVRWIVEGTGINVRVYIESITVSSEGVSGDLDAVIRFREYVDLAAVTVSDLDTSAAAPGNSGQSQTGSQDIQTYTVVEGDMLSVLCRRYYGDGSATYYNALAAYNGIENPHLIYPGTVLSIPPASVLLG